MGGAETRDAWKAAFGGPLGGQPASRVFVTHMHPDHMGLAHWLCERWQAPLWMSGMDYYNARVATLSTSGNGGEAAARFFAAHGMTDAKALAEIGGRTNYYRNLVPEVPANYRRLMDGMRLRIGAHEWVCIDGFGHAPEHIALYCEDLKVLVSGDMLQLGSHDRTLFVQASVIYLVSGLVSVAAIWTLPSRMPMCPNLAKPCRS